jgi:hypothetical protein
VPEKRVKIPQPMVPGATVEGWEVPVVQSTDRWSEVTLEDGTVIRVKPNVISAIRIDGMFDQDGNPGYALKASQTMMVASSPEHLHKGAQKKVQ